MAKQCEYTDQNGQQCGGYAIEGSTYCLSHHPDKKGARLERSKNGGKATSYEKLDLSLQAVAINSPSDVVDVAIQIINEVRAGQLPPKVASTLGYLLGIVLKAYEISDLNHRLEMVESVMLERKTVMRRR